MNWNHSFCGVPLSAQIRRRQAPPLCQARPMRKTEDNLLKKAPGPGIPLRKGGLGAVFPVFLFLGLGISDPSEALANGISIARNENRIPSGLRKKGNVGTCVCACVRAHAEFNGS